MDNVVLINGHRFIEVTNQTTSGPVYSYDEAVAVTKGITRTIAYGSAPIRKKGTSKPQQWNTRLSSKNNKAI
ncbi:MAG: hypothetical protein DRP02_11850 [Candidatus Gerdarchaeota archaeon]|nr:MAG: hypothetical protein DRP02_11850 [Candidatus Gerdarchaeota archaeon]